MKILNIIAQKPMSTGSGIYLTELVRVMAEQGYSQGVVAGVYKDDEINMPAGVNFYPNFLITYLECLMNCPMKVPVIVT